MTGPLRSVTAGDAATKKWAAFQSKISNDLQSIKQGIAQKKHDLDVKHAEKHADRRRAGPWPIARTPALGIVMPPQEMRHRGCAYAVSRKVRRREYQIQSNRPRWPRPAQVHRPPGQSG